MQGDIYIYPAIFDADDEGNGYTVTFPDFPGCITEGDTEEEAFVNAIEALSLHLWGMERDHDIIPEPTPVQDVSVSQSQAVALIRVDMRIMRQNMRERAVRKMVTLPRWLNEAAEEADINFSQTLQDVLKHALNLYMPLEGSGK